MNYIDILNDSRVIERYNKNDEISKDIFNHGLKHIKNVCNIMNEICDVLVSAELVKYLVEQYRLIDKKKKVKIVVNNKCNSDKQLKKMITKGMRRELASNLRKNRFHEKERAIFFISGLIVLVIAFLFLHL